MITTIVFIVCSLTLNEGGMIMKKRVLSIIMCICMIMTLMPLSVFATDDGNVTNGYYDESGVWQAGGDGTKSYTAEDGTKLTLGKTAEDKGNDTYEVTLQVKAETSEELTPPGAAATVLVIDVSGSMDWCANCGSSSHKSSCPNYQSGWFADNSVKSSQSRISAAQTAAKNFLDSYKGNAAGAGRYVAIVKFSTLSSVVLDWVDVSTTDGYKSAVSKINGLSADGGTNLEQGLYTANSQFSKNAVKSVDKAQHYVVALTDGAPTYYGKSGSSPAGGGGSDGSATTNSKTATTAATLRNNATVYTVCFGVANEYTWSDWGLISGTTYGPKVGDFLRDSIATSGCAYNAADAQELYTAFADISNSISSSIGSSGEGAYVTDPMGMFVSAGLVPANFFEEDSGYKWSLETVTPAKSTVGGVTTYTYSYVLKYTVTIDADAEGFDETVFHPANQPTVLTWPTGETFEFPVPGIKGETSRYTVTYVKGDHGVLNGGDASVQYENIKKWSDTVTADRPTPDVTADDGYYFVGWEPVIADKVTGNAVYVAQYAKQTEVVITGDSNTVDYNGTEQSVTTYQVAGVDAAALTGISYVAKGTDAGTYAGKFSGTPVITIDGKDVTEQYKITYKTGELVVNKLDVVLKSGSDSKVYDGQPLTNKTVDATGFVAGEGASYSDFASITQKGEKDNTFNYTLNDNTKASNYNIKVEYGKLSITPVTDTIKVIAGSDEKVYDGKALTKDSYKVEGTLAEGDELVAVVSGTITDVGSVDNEITSYKVMHGDKDVTASYANIVTVDGKLVVTQREVTLTSDTDSKTYDGKALTCEKVDVSGMGFVKGEGAEYSDFASITNVGTVDNTFKYTLKSNTKAENYKITVVNGKLTVSQAETKITVTANDGSKTYDGKPLEENGYSFDGKLADGDKLVVVVEGSQLDAGESANVVKEVKIVNAANEDVTANYKNIETVEGKLVVSQREVILTSGSDSKTYDGQPLSKEDVSVGGNGFVKGEGASYSSFASITEVGSTDNTFDYALNENTKAENYKITVINGKLEVEAMGGVIVTITENSGEYTYDGSEKTVEGYVVKSISNELYTDADFTFSGSAVVTGTDVGTYDMAVVPADFANTNPNFKNVTFVVEDGQLVINPLEGVVVTVTENSGEYTYDGSEKTVEGYVVKSISNELYTAEDFTFTGSAVVTGTDVGTYDMDVVPADFANTNPNFKNVTFVVEDGQLVINPLEGVVVTVTENSGEYTYDGTEKTVEGYTVKSISDPLYTEADFTFTGSAVVTGTDVGAYDMAVVPADFINTSSNFKDVTFVVEDGQLVINPLEGVVVTVTENSGEYTYDGSEKTVEGYVVKSISNELYTDADFTFSGSAVVTGTVVGTYDMTVVPADFANTNPNFKDVTFVVEDGQLVIKPVENEIVIKANDASKVYDGTALTDAGFSFTQGILADGDVLTAVVEGSQLDAGSCANVVTSYKVMRSDVDVTDCYTFGESENGLLQVSKRPVTLTSGTDSKTYDGTPLTKEEVTVGGDGFVEGEGASYSGFASITDKGSVDNTFRYALNDNTKADNYDITVINGKLTIAPVGRVIVTITENSGEYTYDGTEKTVEGYTVSSSDPLYTEADFAFNGNAVVKGTVVGTYDMELVPENFSNTNENFVDVQFVIVDGQLTIKPVAAEIIISTNSAEKVYDGKALTDAGYSYTENVLAEGDVLTVNVVGSQTNAGSCANAVESYKVMRGDVDVTDCYTFGEVNEGTLKVTPKSVVITSGSASKEYDGKALTCDKITAEGFIDGEGAQFSVTGSQTEVGSSKNTIEYTLNENTLAGNYDITVVEGTLTVTPEKAPKTGDDTNNALWAGLMAVSAAGIAGITLLRKKEDEEA